GRWAGPDVRTARALQQVLERPALAEAAVQHGEHHIARERPQLGRCDAVDGPLDDLKLSALLESSANAARADQAHRALRVGPAAPPQRRAAPRRGSPPAAP